MAEYIEREAVETMLEDAQLISDGEYCGYCTEDVTIYAIPAADVAEVKHGTWLPQIVLGQKAWDCSECKTLGSPQWNWCPICGTKMDGERRSE